MNYAKIQEKIAFAYIILNIHIINIQTSSSTYIRKKKIIFELQTHTHTHIKQN
jgi:hypothetical protein